MENRKTDKEIEKELATLRRKLEVEYTVIRGQEKNKTTSSARIIREAEEKIRTLNRQIENLLRQKSNK